MLNKIIPNPTVEEWLEQSPWWRDEQTYNRYSLDTYGFWAIYEDDDEYRGTVYLLTVEGTLRNAIKYAIESLGETFYGWGHNGRIYKTEAPTLV